MASRFIRSVPVTINDVLDGHVGLDLALRDHVIAPILAGGRSPRMGRKPKIWTAVDRDYETLRIGMQTLFRHVGIETQAAAAQTTFCRSENASSYVSLGAAGALF
jgi:hypothetical protein